MFKHTISILSCALLIISSVLLVTGCGGKKQVPPQNTQSTTQTQPQQELVQPKTETTAVEKKAEPMSDKTPKFATISVKIGETNAGKIKFKFYTKEAPKTCANFVKLAESGFYNGLIFHRVISGFMIQGGDPSGNGTGGPGYTVPAEFNSNITHIRGAVATARQGDQVNPTKASSGSQFYICHAPAHFLDGNYTIFGQVTEGLDVVDKIAAVKTAPGDKPTIPVVMEKVTIEY